MRGSKPRVEGYRGVEMACEEVEVPLSSISVFGEDVDAIK